MTIIFHDSVCFDIYYVGLIMSTDVAEYRQIRKHITAALRDFGVGKKSIESKVNNYILEVIPKGLQGTDLGVNLNLLVRNRHHFHSIFRSSIYCYVTHFGISNYS